MTIVIAGAGMAGLLAGNMLIRRRPVIMEAQSEIPNNHSAVLRFRSSVVGDVLGIPFRSINMIKSSLPWRNDVADALAYSHKNLGVRLSDRSITSGMVVQQRWMAPAELIARMAEPLKQLILLGVPAAFTGPSRSDVTGEDPIISTIPMPQLMAALKYPPHMNGEIGFSHRPGTNVRAKVEECDAYVSLLVPDPALPFSRISLVGDELIVECPGEALDDLQASGAAAKAAELLGIPRHHVSGAEAKRQKFAKIAPINEEQRRDFIYWASTHHNVWSLGRFATWRPGLLLDDLVQDVRKIERWITAGGYEARRDG